MVISHSRHFEIESKALVGRTVIDNNALDYQPEANLTITC